MKDALEIALLTAAAFERAGVAYFLGGSLASSFQGEPRATNDIDFVVELATHRVDLLVRELGADFDVDVDALKEATRRGGSWNIFYSPQGTKIDLFMLGGEPFDEAEFSRRARVDLGGSQLFIKSAEDTVLRKLLWFLAGGQVSSKQWRDIVEVLRVSGAAMDRRYLDGWARRLGLSEWLARADAEAGAV